jgi:membrane protein involved in colicin uptake
MPKWIRKIAYFLYGKRAEEQRAQRAAEENAAEEAKARQKAEEERKRAKEIELQKWLASLDRANKARAAERHAEWEQKREAEAKVRAEQNAEDARKEEELQARFKATAELRKRNDDRIKKFLPTSDDEPKKTAETIKPEDEPISKDAAWDDSFDDLDPAYWEWYFDRRQSLPSEDPPRNSGRDKDE